MIFITIIAFVVIFSLLILVHEWGHFTMARRAGIKVEEFGIGLPPRAKKLFKDKQGTIYSLNWIPFGGYVRLYGEDSSDPKVLKAKNSFASKTIAQRIGVIIGGVVMNFFLAWVLITIGFVIGMRPFLVTQEDLTNAIDSGLATSQHVLYVHEIAPDSPAYSTELKTGDAIVSVNGSAAPLAESFNDALKKNEENTLTIKRELKEMQILITPNAQGKVGFSISDEDLVTEIKEIKHPVHVAPLKAAQEVGRLSVLTVQMLGDVVVNLVSRFTIPDGVAGPVGIARMTHTFVQQGLMALLQFTALISISLGVINIMPFPALDGGRLLFIVFELITRRRANAKWEAIIHALGFGLLMLLILIVTWNDILMIIK